MKYSVSLIGCGRVGVLLEDDPLRKKPASHIGGILNLKDKVFIDSVCDIDDNKLQYVKKRWKINKIYNDYKKLIKERKPDIVIISTWTNTHKDIAEFCIKNKIKGIVLEKPVSTNMRDGKKILSLSEKYGTRIVINHERRWDGLYNKTKQIIDNKELGQLKTIFANVFTQSFIRGNWKTLIDFSGGGPLLHDGTHLVDIIRYFSGEVDYLIGNLEIDNETGIEKRASSYMKMNNKTDVFLQAGSQMDFFNFELDLIFEKGRIKIGNGIKEFYTTDKSKRYSGFNDLIKRDFPSYEKVIDPFSGALNEVIESINKNIEPYSSIYDGIKSMEIIFAIYYSHCHKNKKIRFPYKNLDNPLINCLKN